MEESQLPLTKRMKMDNPKTLVEEQGVGKGEAGQRFIEMHGRGKNSRYIEISVSRKQALDGIMVALTCDVNKIIGVCGQDATEKFNLLEKVSRRVEKDELFDVVVKASVTQKPNNKRIQDEIAEALCFKFDKKEKDVAKRAERLRDRILMERKILVMLPDLCEGLDLGKIGIPFGADHTGCKVLLTSTSEEVLSKKMSAQEIFKL